MRSGHFGFDTWLSVTNYCNSLILREPFVGLELIVNCSFKAKIQAACGPRVGWGASILKSEVDNGKQSGKSRQRKIWQEIKSGNFHQQYTPMQIEVRDLGNRGYTVPSFDRNNSSKPMKNHILRAETAEKREQSTVAASASAWTTGPPGSPPSPKYSTTASPPQARYT